MSKDPILQDVLKILDHGLGLSKVRNEGHPLMSQREGPAVIDPLVVDALRSGAPLDQEMQRALIFALDLLAAGAPDNVRSVIEPEVQRVAGTLRQRYSRAYKASAYSVD